jgi:hypothetical protein
VMALTDLDNLASQRVAGRLGMQDEGATDRWYGSMTRQFRKVFGSPVSGPGAPGHVAGLASARRGSAGRDCAKPCS